MLRVGERINKTKVNLERAWEERVEWSSVGGAWESVVERVLVSTAGERLGVEGALLRVRGRTTARRMARVG